VARARAQATNAVSIVGEKASMRLAYESIPILSVKVVVTAVVPVLVDVDVVPVDVVDVDDVIVLVVLVDDVTVLVDVVLVELVALVVVLVVVVIVITTTEGAVTEVTATVYEPPAAETSLDTNEVSEDESCVDMALAAAVPALMSPLVKVTE
jgi:hypothetical protein